MTPTIEALCNAYSRFVAIPWTKDVAGAERVWMAIYPPAQERRLRMRIKEFETATLRAGHTWRLIDITDMFPQWLADNEYRDSYFEDPDLLGTALEKFGQLLALNVAEQASSEEVDTETVVAVLGAGSLYGMYRVSRLVEQVQGKIRGRLLVFFPGHRQDNNYRLLDGHDGWNYMATPIEAYEEIL